MRIDPLDRLRDLDPARECPPPPIEPVWQRIELEESSGPTRSPHQARGSFILRFAPGVLTMGVAVAVAAVLLILLGGHSSAPRLHGPQRPVTAQPTAVSPSVGRKQLVRSLGLLRRAQSTADRQAARSLGHGGLLPHVLAGQSAGICRASHDRVAGCGTRIDRSLVRRVELPRWQGKVLVVPLRVTRSVSGIPRGQSGIVFALKAPHLGASSDSMNGGSVDLEAVSTLPLTPAPAFERRGAIATYDVQRPGQWATALNRIAVLVPDGVTQVTLADISLADQTSGRALKRLGSLTAEVHHNVALMQIGNLTIARLGSAVVHKAAISSSTAGTRCTTTARLYTVRATAHVRWRRDGHQHARGSAPFYLYINATPPHPTRSKAPQCQH